MASMDPLDLFRHAYYTFVHRNITAILAKFSRPDNYYRWASGILDILSSHAVRRIGELFSTQANRGILLCRASWRDRIHAYAIYQYDAGTWAWQPDDDLGISSMDNMGSPKTIR